MSQFQDEVDQAANALSELTDALRGMGGGASGGGGGDGTGGGGAFGASDADIADAASGGRSGGRFSGYLARSLARTGLYAAMQLGSESISGGLNAAALGGNFSTGFMMSANRAINNIPVVGEIVGAVTGTSVEHSLFDRVMAAQGATTENFARIGMFEPGSDMRRRAAIETVRQRDVMERQQKFSELAGQAAAKNMLGENPLAEQQKETIKKAFDEVFKDLDRDPPRKHKGGGHR